MKKIIKMFTNQRYKHLKFFTKNIAFCKMLLILVPD